MGWDRKNEIVLLCLISLFQWTPPALDLRSQRGYISCGAPFHLGSLACLDFSLLPSFMWQPVQLLLQLYLFQLNRAISVCVCVYVCVTKCFCTGLAAWHFSPAKPNMWLSSWRADPCLSISTLLFKSTDVGVQLLFLPPSVVLPLRNICASL